MSTSTTPPMSQLICLLVQPISAIGCNTTVSHLIQQVRIRCLERRQRCSHSLNSSQCTNRPLETHQESLSDVRLFFDKHIDNVFRGGYYHILALRHVWSSASRQTANIAACTIVSSRFDYCNSVLTGMSSANLDRLQRVQNTLTCVVTGTPR